MLKTEIGSRKISAAAVLVLGFVCIALSIDAALSVVISWGLVRLGARLALLFPVGIGLIAIGCFFQAQDWRKSVANKKFWALIFPVILNVVLLSVVFAYIGFVDYPFLPWGFHYYAFLCWNLVLYFALPLLVIVLVIYVIVWQARLGWRVEMT